MSVTFGFVGQPNPNLLETMSGSLLHRGKNVICVQTAIYSVGFRSDHNLDCVDDEGLYVEKNSNSGFCALAGFQTAGKSGGTFSLEELYQRNRLIHFPPVELSGDFVMASYRPQSGFSLIRDPAGARTVYYANFDGRFFFSSEPKGIWNLPGFPKQIDENSLAKYLAFSFVPGSPTMLKGVSELTPGTTLRLDRENRPTLQRYFQFEKWENPDHFAKNSQYSTQPDENWIQEFKQVLTQTTRDRLSKISGNPCLFLSGGLDSSVVAAEVCSQSSLPVETFSLHFGSKYRNELEFAASVASRLKTNHHEVQILPKNFLGNLREMIWHLDDPIGDPITMPNYELAKIVGRKTDFVFNGEGGDPCFGGPKNLSLLMAHWYGTQQGRKFREIEYLKSYRRAYEELDHVFSAEFSSKIDRDSLPSVLTPFFETNTPRSFLNKLLAINIRLKGAHLILPKVERMLAASKLSPLSPLFSQEMIQLSFQIPTRLKLAGGIEKVILKKAFAGRIPDEVITRPKSGMRVPVHFWFQSELKKYARKILSPRQVKKAGIFNPNRIKQLLDYNIEQGSGRYGIRLWMLITFEIWRRIVIEGEAV